MPFMAWKELFQHLEVLLMDDYHKLKCAREIQIQEWHLYWLFNYISIPKGLCGHKWCGNKPSNNATNGSGNIKKREARLAYELRKVKD